MDECVNTMWHIHAMEYSLALKRKEILLHATAWTSFEDLCKWNKPVTETQILYDSTYMGYSHQIHGDMKTWTAQSWKHGHTPLPHLLPAEHHSQDAVQIHTLFSDLSSAPGIDGLPILSAFCACRNTQQSLFDTDSPSLLVFGLCNWVG